MTGKCNEEMVALLRPREESARKLGIQRLFSSEGLCHVSSVDPAPYTIFPSVSSREDVVTLLRQQDPAVRQLGVQRLGLFGSFQRRTQTPDSDVDLFVEFQPGAATFDHFMQLNFLCEDLFGRSVEIVTPGSLSPYLGPRIIDEVEYVLQ